MENLSLGHFFLDFLKEFMKNESSVGPILGKTSNRVPQSAIASILFDEKGSFRALFP